MENWAEIRRLHLTGKMPIEAIARRLGVARNTVRSALASPEPPRYERPAKGSVLDVHEARLVELLTEFPDMPSTVIAERLGYTGASSVLRARVRPLESASDHLLGIAAPSRARWPAASCWVLRWLGAAMAGVGGALTVWVLQVTGTAPTMMGDLAEQWTASELRPLRHRGWRLVNHVRLRRWDIDHVLVGPGGALAVETKWSARPWVLQPPEERVLLAARQARHNADDLQRWAEFRRAGAPPVQPVVTLWGLGSGQLQTPAGGLQIDGVSVVPGPVAQRWRDSLPEQVLLTQAQVDTAWSALDRHTRLRDQRDPEPLPRSVGQVAGTTVATVGAALLAFVAAAGLLALLGSVYTWTPVCLGLVALSEPLRRRRRSRLPALGWQTGLVGMLTVAGASLFVA